MSESTKPTDWGDPADNEDYHSDEGSRHHVATDQESEARLDQLNRESEDDD